MYKNIAWCTGLGMSEEVAIGMAETGVTTMPLGVASTYHSGHRARDLWLFDTRTTPTHQKV